jgi:hypothetical protein
VLCAAPVAGAEVRAGFPVPDAGRVTATAFRLDVDLGAREKAPLAAGAEAVKRRDLAKNVVLVGTIRRLAHQGRGKAVYVGVVALFHARTGRSNTTGNTEAQSGAEAEHVCWRRRPAGAATKDDAEATLFTGLPARVASTVRERGALTQAAALLSVAPARGRCRAPDLARKLERGLSGLVSDDRRTGPNFSWSAAKAGPAKFGDPVVDAVGGAVLGGELSPSALRAIERQLGRRFGPRFKAGSLDGDRVPADTPDESTDETTDETSENPATSEAQAPEVQTGDATLRSDAPAADVTAFVNPHRKPTQAFFEYGPTTAYGATAPLTSPASGLDPDGDFDQRVRSRLAGLIANTTYHFRIVARNELGTRTGDDATFTTPAGPDAVTGDATTDEPTAALLQGSVDPHDSRASAAFDYGTTTDYGSAAVATGDGGSPISGDGPVAVSAAIAGLAPNTTYHYRLRALTPWGVSVGGDRTFTTSSTVTYRYSLSIAVDDGRHLLAVSPDPDCAGGPPACQELAYTGSASSAFAGTWDVEIFVDPINGLARLSFPRSGLPFYSFSAAGAVDPIDGTDSAGAFSCPGVSLTQFSDGMPNGFVPYGAGADPGTPAPDGPPAPYTTTGRIDVLIGAGGAAPAGAGYACGAGRPTQLHVGAGVFAGTFSADCAADDVQAIAIPVDRLGDDTIDVTQPFTYHGCSGIAMPDSSAGSVDGDVTTGTYQVTLTRTG